MLATSMTIEELQRCTNELSTRCNQARGALAVLQPQLAAAQHKYEELGRNQMLWREVQTLLGHLSELAREQARMRIEETVTAALQAVFPEPLTFRVALRQVAGQTVADWEVVSVYGGSEVATSIEDSRGGGIADVVSLALRLALLELIEPKPDGPLILDEPGKMISREYLPAMAEFLKQYATRTHRQVIMITHHSVLADTADRCLRVSKRDGKSEVSEA
jgi:DNA repair ATPase RecN